MTQLAADVRNSQTCAADGPSRQIPLEAASSSLFLEIMASHIKHDNRKIRAQLLHEKWVTLNLSRLCHSYHPVRAPD